MWLWLSTLIRMPYYHTPSGSLLFWKETESTLESIKIVDYHIHHHPNHPILATSQHACQIVVPADIMHGDGTSKFRGVIMLRITRITFLEQQEWLSQAGQFCGMDDSKWDVSHACFGRTNLDCKRKEAVKQSNVCSSCETEFKVGLLVYKDIKPCNHEHNHLTVTSQLELLKRVESMIFINQGWFSNFLKCLLKQWHIRSRVQKLVGHCWLCFIVNKQRSSRV